MANGGNGKTWVKKRHRVMRLLMLPFVWALCKLRMGVRMDRFNNESKMPYLILYNHQTPYDQFFLYISFNTPLYCVATEDIFSNGFVSKLISWMFNPIPITKRSDDLQAIRNTVRAAKEGASVAIAPEGNRTYSGKTEHINPSMIKLVRMIDLPIAFYRIEGGYGVEPRWSDKPRRGRMHAYVSEVLEKDAIKAMSDDELYEKINQALYVNEAKADGLYKSKRRAEYLERAVYVCPQCGLAKFRSKGNEIECLSCGSKIEYGEDKTLRGIGFDFPFAFVNDWYEYQNEFVRKLDLEKYVNEEMFLDRNVKVSRVIPKVEKIPVYSSSQLKLFGDRVEILSDAEEKVLSFNDIEAAAVLGKNKMNIYHGGNIYQFKGEKPFNALKYVNIISRYKNTINGETDGEFLGL